MAIVRFESNAPAVKAKINGNSRTALEVVLSSIQQESRRRTPVDTGDLRQSTQWRIDEVGGGLRGQVGSHLDYAVEVHERLNVPHPIGEAKFLWNAVTQNLPAYKKLLSDNISAGLTTDNVTRRG